MTIFSDSTSSKIINFYYPNNTTQQINKNYKKISLKGVIKGCLKEEYYFDAKFTFVITNNKIYKIKIHDINYKNKFDVSITDRTDEYKYLYNISSESSNNSLSYLSLGSDIIIEKKIYKSIHDIISGIKLEINNNSTKIILPEHNINLTNYKIKAKITDSSEISNKHSNSTSNKTFSKSLTIKNIKSNSKMLIIKRIIKIITISVILFYIVVLLFKNNNIQKNLNSLKLFLIKKIKNE